MSAIAQFGYVGDYLLWWLLFLSLVAHVWCFFRFFPRKRRPKSGLVLGNSLVFLCMVGVLFLLGETYYRYLAVELDSFGLTLPARRWFALYTNLNSLGCRDDEWSRPKPDGVHRIAFVGDSYVYGWGIENPEDRFTELLQANFERTGQPVEILNVAKPGWGTKDQVQPVADMIQHFGVGEVVLCVVPNDIEKLIPKPPGLDPTRPPDPAWFNPDASYLMEQWFYRVVVPRAPSVQGYHDWLAGGYADPTVWRRQEQLFGEIATTCREHGATLRVLLLPFLKTGGNRFDAHGIHKHLHRFFDANRIEVLDLLPVIADRDTHRLVVNTRDAHPNEQAHQLFADAIWQAFYARQVPANGE